MAPTHRLRYVAGDANIVFRNHFQLPLENGSYPSNEP